MNGFRSILAVAPIFLALAGGLPAWASRSAAPLLDAGLLVSRAELLQQPGTMRFRAAGPVVERVRTANGRTFSAFRPVVSRVSDPATRSATTHVLWPLFSSIRKGDDRRWNSALVAWGVDTDVRNPTSQWNLVVFPVLAAGRTSEGRRYGGLFPLGGHLEEILGRDEIDFALFPLYSHSRQRSLETWNLLFPLISWTRGENKARFRVFPFYGQVRDPGISKRFILWPIWNEAHYSAPQHAGYSYMLFPFFGRVNLDNQQTWMALPPFFRYSETTNFWELHAPWPFVQLKRGHELDQTYLWPLWGIRERPGVKDGFMLWPLGTYERHDLETEILVRRWFVPFYFDERRFQRVPGAEPLDTRRYLRIWPLASYRREADSLRFRTLELWPLAPNDPVERLYAPFWTLYAHEREGGVVSDEALWGLFRRIRGDGLSYTSVFPLVSWGGSADNDQKRWDVLKGLVGYERDGETRVLRLFYLIRLGQ